MTCRQAARGENLCTTDDRGGEDVGSSFLNSIYVGADRENPLVINTELGGVDATILRQAMLRTSADHGAPSRLRIREATPPQAAYARERNRLRPHDARH